MGSIDIYTKKLVANELYKTKNALAKRVDTYYNHLHYEGNFIKVVDNQIEPFLKSKDTLILDIGCGIGRPLLPVGPTVYELPDKMVNIDISYGMLEEVKKNCKIRNITSIFLQCDAENLPFTNESFKIVMARHMLYHVSNIIKAVEEIARVLHKDGIFLATTNAKDSKREFFDLHYNSLKLLKHPIFIPRGVARFNEENGRIILQQFFKNLRIIEWTGYFDFLSVNEFMKYYTSTPYFKKASSEKEELRKLYTIVADNVEAIIKTKGIFRVFHHGVIFICRNKIGR
ncbi:MAG: class I SAM-dependent methyltransferase [Bacteroidales bacterium]